MRIALQRLVRGQPTLEELSERARGVVSFGGKAVEDCDRLYDGSWFVLDANVIGALPDADALARPRRMITSPQDTLSVPSF